MPSLIKDNYWFSWNLYRNNKFNHRFDDVLHEEHKTESLINQEFDAEVNKLLALEKSLQTKNTHPIKLCKMYLRKYTNGKFASIFKYTKIESKDIDFDKDSGKINIVFWTGWYYDHYHPRLIVYMRLMK